METSTAIYGYERESALLRYASRIHGSPAGMFLALSAQALSDPAQEALEKSVDSLGWGPQGVSFAQTAGMEPSGLFALVEAIDPLAIVVADAPSARLFAEAYRLDPAGETPVRVFCRETRIIPEMESLMQTIEGKQRIWASLKTLPRA